MTTPRSEQETILSYDRESGDWHYYSDVPKHNRKWADLVGKRTQFVEKDGTIEILKELSKEVCLPVTYSNVGGNKSKSGRSAKSVSGQEK